MPNYLFIHQNNELRKEYEQSPKLTDIFPVNVLGFQTHRDDYAITLDKGDIEKRVGEILDKSISDETIFDKYKIKDNRDWQLSKSRSAMQSNNKWCSYMMQCDYRPFDKRWCLFGYEMMDYPRRELLNHVALKDNFQLLTPRQLGTDKWQHTLIARDVAESCAVSNKTREGNYNFPLYLYPDASDAQGDLMDATSTKRKPNLDDKIVADIAKKLKLLFVSDHEDKKAGDHSRFSSLDLLDYIYAVLHSPTYRSTYKEFLKIDFPRVPYPADAKTFWQLVALGGELRALHLLEHPLISKPITTYPIGGDNMVEKPTYADGKVHINKEQYFGGVPEVAWNFYIGGYQPAQKWLKDRKGRTLTLDDLRHYAKIIIALTETDRLMKEIDTAWKP